MRILFVNYEYPPLGGGGGIAMKEIAEELANRHEVHVLTSGAADMPTTERHAGRNLTIHRTKVLGRNARATASFVSMGSFLVSGIRRGTELLAHMKFDVVNTWFAIPSGVVGTTVARKASVPHVLTIIGGDIYDPSKWYSPHRFAPAGVAVKWSLRRADRLIAISSDIARRAREYFNVKEEIEIISLGIAEPAFQPVSRQQLDMASNRKYVVAVGRLVRRKDYPTLIRSIKALGRDDVSLIILGDGPERDNLTALANELEISDQVELRGFVAESVKYQILANSDVFALVSLHEGFGIVYLEAMYCGLPVIAANEGGQIDILKDGQSGSLVPVNDVDKLTEALRLVIEEPGLGTRFSEHNRGKFQDLSIARLATRYETAFEQLAVSAGEQ